MATRREDPPPSRSRRASSPDLETRLDWLEEAVGRSPDPNLDQPGSGVLRALSALREADEGLAETMARQEALLTEIRASVARQESTLRDLAKRPPGGESPRWRRIAAILGGIAALIAAIATGAAQLISAATGRKPEPTHTKDTTP